MTPFAFLLDLIFINNFDPKIAYKLNQLSEIGPNPY